MLNFEYVREVGLINWLLRTFRRQFYKRILRKVHMVQLPSGAFMKLPVESHLASEVYISGANIDNGSEALFYALLPANSCMYDVGANVGYYSVYMAPKVSRCFAFEPDPRSAVFLRNAIVGYPQVLHVPYAVSSSCGEATFYQHSQMEVSGLSVVDVPGSGINVNVVTLDQFKKNEGEGRRVDAIKIDVEGFDFEVIKGAREILKTDYPIVVTEALASYELINYVHELGYSVFGFIRTGRLQSILREITNPGEYSCKMIFLIHSSRLSHYKRTAGLSE